MALHFHKHLLWFCLLTIGFLFCSHASVSACSCGPRPTVLDSFDKSEVVIIARAISVEKVPEFSEDRRYVDGVRTTTMVVERVFKGNLKVRDEIVFRQGGGADCIWTFSEKSVGQEFLFYLDTPEITATLNNVPDKDDKLWVAFGCGRSNNLSGATDDLLYLQNMTKVRGKTRISGTLGGWENPDLDVAGKTIRIIGAKKTYETKTNSEGVFEVYDLPPGKYLIEPQMPSGWKVNPYSARYSPSVERDEYEESGAKPKQLTIVLEPKKHAGVDISFTIDNAIHGSVVDPNSRPMAGVCLYLVHKDGSPGGGFGCTDEKGKFEITSVPRGEFLLVLNHDGKLSSREPFKKFYYPNVTGPEQAAVISIRPGEIINDIDVVVPSLVETITVEGVLRFSDGKPVADRWIEFKASQKENVSGDVTEKSDENGRFSLKILKGQKGDLSSEMYVYRGEFEDCPKLDELIKKGGRDFASIKTNSLAIEADDNIYNLELAFPFPGCKKKEQR